MEKMVLSYKMRDFWYFISMNNVQINMSPIKSKKVDSINVTMVQVQVL